MPRPGFSNALGCVPSFRSKLPSESARENGRKGLEENSAFIASRNRRPGLVRGMHCIHTTFTCSPSFIRECREQANETGAGIQIHLEESPYEADYTKKKHHKLPVELYDDVGFWGPDVLASQRGL